MTGINYRNNFETDRLKDSIIIPQHYYTALPYNIIVSVSIRPVHGLARPGMPGLNFNPPFNKNLKILDVIFTFTS